MTKLPDFLRCNREKISDWKLDRDPYPTPHDAKKWHAGLDYYMTEYARVDPDPALRALAAVECACESAGVISRVDIFRMAREAGSKPSESAVMLVFLAAMIWGYGRRGYGPYRVGLMLSSDGCAKTLASAHRRLTSEDDVRSAYRDFVNGKISRCGPAFFTKYFYFLGDGCSVKPLILDSVVKKKLATYCEVKTSHSEKGYMQYIADMNAWAREMDVEPWQIECFLFYLAE